MPSDPRSTEAKAVTSEKTSSRDRSAPKPWDTDWLLLRKLSSIIRDELGTYVGKGSRLVDMGCGDMPYRGMIETIGINYLGADLGSSADLAIEADGRVDLPDGSVTAVLSIQVLEHVRDLDSYCQEMRRILSTDGRLFLSTHGTWLYHPHPEDHRRWTRTGLILDLEKRGFAVEDVQPLLGPLATTTVLRLTGFAYVLRKIPFMGPTLAGLLAVIMNGRGLLEEAITPDSIRRNNACVYWVRARPR